MTSEKKVTWPQALAAALAGKTICQKGRRIQMLKNEHGIRLGLHDVSGVTPLLFTPSKEDITSEWKIDE